MYNYLYFTQWVCLPRFKACKWFYSRSCFTNDIAFSIIQWFWNKIKKPFQGLGKTSLDLHIVNPPGKRAHFCMSIMKEVHSKMCNKVTAKVTFPAECFRQFDILQVKEATFLSVDGCSEFSMPGYQLKPSDRGKQNWSIKEHRGEVKKLLSYWKMWRSTIPHSYSPMGLL